MIIDALPNKSMDVRAKQRISYRVAWFLLACVVAVSPHVISAVMRLNLRCVFEYDKTDEE